jgi:hypothetical protein
MVEGCMVFWDFGDVRKFWSWVVVEMLWKIACFEMICAKKCRFEFWEKRL